MAPGGHTLEKRRGPETVAAAVPAIHVEGLVKRFGAVTAVDGVSFDVARSSAVGLLGGNGAGKTTTIAILLGLILPTAGVVEMLGEDMLRHRYRVLPRMNFSSPYVDLPRRLTTEENLRVYAHLYGVRRVAERIEQLAETLELTEFLRRPVGSLSSGQRSRVALAKALVNEPALLLLDEPTASMDPDTADRMRGHLEQYRVASGATILLASHNMGEVERLCSDVIMLKEGRMVDRGAPQALLAKHGRDTLEQVFLDIARQGGADGHVAAQ